MRPQTRAGVETEGRRTEMETPSSEKSLAIAHRGLAAKISAVLRKMADEENVFVAACRLSEAKIAELTRIYQTAMEQRDNLGRRVRRLFGQLIENRQDGAFPGENYEQGEEDDEISAAEVALVDANYAYKQMEAKCERLRKAISEEKSKRDAAAAENFLDNVYIYKKCNGARPLKAELRENHCLIEKIKKVLSTLQRKIEVMRAQGVENHDLQLEMVLGEGSFAESWRHLGLPSKLLLGNSVGSSDERRPQPQREGSQKGSQGGRREVEEATVTLMA